MSSPSPPLALRILYLPDRLVLHALNPSNHFDPSNRNALIDAANAAHRQQTTPSTPRPTLLDVDLPPPPSPTFSGSPRDRFLVIPFSGEPPREVSSQEHAGVPAQPPQPLAVEAAAGLLGILHLPSGRYAVIVTQVRRAGLLPAARVYAVVRVRFVPLTAARTTRPEEKELVASMAKVLESGALYFSYGTDLTRAMDKRRRRGVTAPNAFWWTWPMAERLDESANGWAMRTVYGYVGSHLMRFQCREMERGAGEFLMTVVSRRSRRRAGTRFITRGVDAAGDVANFVETEQVVWVEERPEAFASFVIIRGSVPVFWRQNNGIARPVPELDGSLAASRSAFRKHFADMRKSYGGVAAVSLVDKHGSEGVLADAFERHFELDLRAYEGEFRPKLVAFDFHRHCAGKEYERGLAMLMESLMIDVGKYGLFSSGFAATEKNCIQNGVFRVNCVDCLDRTNVVQSMICRVALKTQLEVVFSFDLLGKGEDLAIRLYGESEDKFKQIWGDNADAISKQYSGTGALKTDFTRTGKRSTTGVIGDGMKSVMRMYYKNFVDEGRQEVIDILTGNAVIRPPTRSESNLIDVVDGQRASNQTDSPESGLWYSFEAMKVNASGDKQHVSVELHDDAMLVTTGDGVATEYPRHSLVGWSKFEEGKSSDRKSPVRLRLVYDPSRESPATTSPLDLQFKGGTPSRETFLRALVSWAKPEVSFQLKGEDVRVQVLASLNVGEHYMRDWGLDGAANHLGNEVVALVLPQSHAGTRPWGIAAVPLDVDQSNFSLVSACAVTNRGPAIAILVSKRAAPTVMNVAEATSGHTADFAAGGAAAVALNVMGTSFCFVSGRLTGPEDVFHTLSSLKLGRYSSDVTNQFHHFALAGLLGDMQWQPLNTSSRSRNRRKWKQLSDGSYCYSMANGLSVVRNSFPTLKYENKLGEADTATEDLSLKNEISGSRPRETFVTLADGVVEGRPGPSLPREASYCIVTIAELRGENIKTPPGVDSNSQLSPFMTVHCEFSSADTVASHHAVRPSAFPEWDEPIHVLMIPSDPEEIYNSFMVGHVATPTPLADPVSAGHFVIPIAFARNGTAQFSVPCRLAGIHTGNLQGVINVEVGGHELMLRSGAMMKSKTSRSSKRSGSNLSGTGQNSLPPVSGQMSLERASGIPVAGSVQRRPKSASSSKSGGFVASLPPSLRQKPSMDEVNVKLDAARKKGSKQIKSVVNRLSSLLNQPSSSSSLNLTRNSRIARIDDVSHDDMSSVSSFKELADETHARQPGHRNQGDSREQITNSRTVDPDSRHLVGLGLRPVAADNTSSGMMTTESPTKSKGLLLDTSDDFSSFGGFQAAPRARTESATEVKQSLFADDPLLSGLRASAPVAPQPSSHKLTVPVHAQTDSVDLLLGGLSNEKSKIQKQAKVEDSTDDGWGAFEGA